MPRVLVVDDQKDVRAMVSIVLRVNRYDVVEAESGAAGLKAFGENVFDAAIVDIFLTDTSGIEAAVNAVLPGSMQASVTIGCECSNGGGGSPCGSVSGSCSSCPSSTTQRYVHVASSLNASTWFTTPLAITPLSAPSACYVARVQ